MKLTRLQNRYIKALLRNRIAGPTLGIWLQAAWKPWFLSAILCAIAALFFASFSLAISWVYLGLWLGAVLRDISHFRSARRLWPITSEVVDWKRVSELDEEEMKPPVL
jgi:hypothetical protein